MKTIKRVELRVKREHLAESKTPYNICISCPRDVANIARSILSGVDQERFLVFPLDVKKKILGYTEIARGSVDTCPVDPREVFRTAIVMGASAIILVHNHPSGDPNASDEDTELTKRLCKAGKFLGLPILDHLIITPNKSTISFVELGLIPKDTTDMPTPKINDLRASLTNELESSWVKNWTFDGHKIVNWEAEPCRLTLELDDGSRLCILLEESLGSKRICPSCNKMKGGWPNEWENIAGKRLKYACADCTQIEKDLVEKTRKDPVGNS